MWDWVVMVIGVDWPTVDVRSAVRRTTNMSVRLVMLCGSVAEKESG